MIDLTQKQKAILDFIRSFLYSNHYSPTIREIASHFEISVKGAHDHIKALKKKGFLKNDSNGSRTLVLVNDEEEACNPETSDIPLLGTVAAGSPIFAEENFERMLRVPASLTGRNRCFALRIKGDSMIEAGILNGDIAVIQEQRSAVNGDIVVAMIDECVTLKRFYKEKERIRLQPENSSYSPIYSQNPTILGKLRGIVRSY